MIDVTRSHPSREELAAFGLGQLDDASSLEIERHMAQCAACQSVVAELPDDGFVAMLRGRQMDCETWNGVADSDSRHSESCDTATRQGSPDLESTIQPDPADSLSATRSRHSSQPRDGTLTSCCGAGVAGEIPSELVGHPRYNVMELLGAGGMGAVFKAEHKMMHRPVALKLVRRKLIDSRAAIERFHREVMAAARLSHPNIVTAYDAEEAGDAHFLAMEYVEGENLAKVVANRGPLPVKLACQFARQVALGLQHAFEHGMVHRDIKPQNLILKPTMASGMSDESADGVVKILDFGLARYVSEAAVESDLTEFGAIMGTPDYLAPEQARDAHAADIRADIYSLGCTLYFLLTGQPPFPGGSLAEKIAAHLQEPLPPVTQFRKDVPLKLVQILSRMIAKNPDERYQTPAEVAAALAAFAGVSGQPARRWLQIATAAALLIGLGLTGYHTGPVIFRFATNQGQIVVETDDPDVEVLARNSGEEIRIADRKTRRTVLVKAGTYELQLGKGKDGLRLSTDRITLSRGGEQIVRVWREPPHHMTDTAAHTKQPQATVLDTVPVLLEGSDTWINAAHSHVHDIAVSRDGKRALACSGNLVFLFDPESGQELERFPGHAGMVRCVAFSPDERWIASGGHDATVRLWDANSGVEKRQFHTEMGVNGGTPFSFLAFTPDGCQLLGGSRRDVLLWDVASGEALRRFVGHSETPRRLAVSREGDLIASCGHDGTARLWRSDSGELLSTMREGSKWIVDVEFSPDGKFVASGGQTIALWDSGTGKLCWSFPILGKWAEAITFTAGGRHLLAAIGDFKTDGELVVLDVKTGRAVYRSGGLTAYIFDVEMAADGRSVLIGENGGMRRRQLPAPLWHETGSTIPGSSGHTIASARSGPPGSSSDPFVVIGAAGGPERKLASLAEAVAAASNGDTIEIRSDGPIASPPITINRPVVIRAAAGFRPAIRPTPSPAGHLFYATAPLVLEGLELRSALGSSTAPTNYLVHGCRTSLALANCRLIGDPQQAVIGYEFSQCDLRNCEIINPVQKAVNWRDPSQGRLRIENCVHAGSGLAWVETNANAKEVSLKFARITAVTFPGLIGFRRRSAWPPKSPETPPLEVDISGSILEGISLNGASFWAEDAFRETLRFRSSEERNSLLRQLIRWQGKHNLLLPDQAPTWVLRNAADRELVRISEWKSLFPEAQLNSLEGRAKFQGGDLESRLASDPFSLTANDFRLLPDSPGYCAGPDGTDLGADIDLVGPGKAYEEWKQTLEYQDWLKETGQRKTEPPKDEPFMLLGGNGIEVRNFNTLAEAVAAASDGDTIEISSNGPFRTAGLRIDKSLVIRAGTGARPVLQRSASNVPMITANAPLVLEGLELHCEPDQAKAFSNAPISTALPLSVANCRLAGTRLIIARSPKIRVRNCELMVQSATAISLADCQTETALRVENSILTSAGGGGLLYVNTSGWQPDVSVELVRNTILSDWYMLSRRWRLPTSGSGLAAQPLNIDLQDSIVISPHVVAVTPEGELLREALKQSSEQRKQLIPETVHWSARNNVWRSDDRFLKWVLKQPGGSEELAYHTSADWNSFFPQSQALQFAEPHFVGGDVLVRKESELQRLTPDDFRLLPDSPGYRAGPDGKDLGADVDLVGPGEAYERWKQTPDYLQWLNEIGR